MRVVWTSARENRIDHELLWLVVSVGSAIGAGIWLRLGLPWPHCTFLALTGHPCVTCGATRAAIKFAQGHFIAAWLLNPLVSLAYCAIALFDLYAIFALVLGAPRLRLRSPSLAEKKVLRVTVLVLLASNWAYLLWTT